MVRYINGLRKDIKDHVKMYTMNTITNAISLAYKAEKQLQTQPRYYPQRPLRQYQTQSAFEPKTDPQTPTYNTSQYPQKELPKISSNPNTKQGFIPIRNNFKKPNPATPMLNPYQ